MSTQLTARAGSHLLAVLEAFAENGWKPLRAPTDGRLVRNGQLLVLRAGRNDRRFRVFVYKVTGSGRRKPYERRIEITSTYQKGLRRNRDYQDVVLGYDADVALFVGVDPRRIAHGGPTGNASSFFDVAGLGWDHDDEILILPRAARLFRGGIEYHAFVQPSRLGEYFFNMESIHGGTYAGAGLYAGTSTASQSRLIVNDESADGDLVVLVGPRATRGRRRMRDSVVEAYERGGGRRRPLTPEQLAEITRRMEENGRLGEEFVLNYERRTLRRAGRSALADQVQWVSQESVSEGYDIKSYDISGEEKWIEVKATTGSHRVFEMSQNEWNTCCAAGDKYYIYRVSNVRTSPAIEKIRNPQDLETRGGITRSATGWRVTLH